MSGFNPSAYGPVFGELLSEAPVNALVPAEPNRAAFEKLRSLDVAKAFAQEPLADGEMAKACLTGLWLYHGYLEESHRVSQSISTTTGSYWHGIMHRQEPDYGNSKYWFRRVGSHPAFEPVCEGAVDIARSAGDLDATARYLTEQKSWDPFAFVDLCEASATGRVPCEGLCKEIQQREWEVLFDYCYSHAIGG